MARDFSSEVKAAEAAVRAILSTDRVAFRAACYELAVVTDRVRSAVVDGDKAYATFAELVTATVERDALRRKIGWDEVTPITGSRKVG